MILQTFITLLGSILSGILYRCGGSQYYNTLYRDLGSNIITNIAILSLFSFSCTYLFCGLLFMFIISVLLLWASLSTYWDFLNNPEKEDDKTWAVTGFFYGLSALPFTLYTKKYVGFYLRIFILLSFMPLWARFRPNQLRLFNHTWDGAQIEEFGRGVILTLTTPLLLI